MRLASALVLVLAACTARDQQKACDEAIRASVMFDGQADAIVADCVRERWSDRQIECVLRAGPGTMMALFCFPERE